jgi:alkylated DNA repair dioxygenase AlkB
MSTPEGFYFFNQFCSDKKLLADIATYAATLPWHEAPCQYCKIYQGRKRCNGARGGDVWRLYLECRGERYKEFFDRLPRLPEPQHDFQISRTQIVKYSPRAELKTHRDCISFGRIAFLTITGKSLFWLQPSVENNVNRIELIVSPGDLVILSGKAYWEWVHGVKNFDSERIIWLMGDYTNNIVSELSKSVEEGMEFLRNIGVSIE